MMAIFGGSSVLSGLLNLLLPETLGHPLPENLAQVKNLARGSKSEATASTEEEERPLLGSH